MSPDEFLDLVHEEDEKLEWFLREVRDEHENGKSPAEIADELYYRVESPANIEYHVVMAVMFGVLWEKEDADAE